MSCSHYSTSHTSIFKLLDCEKGVVISRKYIDETFIVFILKGKLSINYDSEHPMDVGEFSTMSQPFILRQRIRTSYGNPVFPKMVKMQIHKLF